MRRHVIAYLSIIAIFYDTAGAQSSSKLIMEKVNENIVEKSAGFFTIEGLWKSATSDDTVRQKGEVYFFRSETNNPDSICAFSLSRGGQMCEAFDGQLYYHIGSKNKLITISRPFDERGVYQMIKGGYRHRWAFPPFLVANKKTPFNLAKFENAITDTVLINGTRFAIIQVVDSSENKHKLSSSDPDVMTIKEVYEVSLEDYSLRRLVQEAHFWSSPQYEEFIFSSIVSLPGSTTFFQTFKLDSLLSSGFDLTKKKPHTPVPPPDSHIKPGMPLILPALIDHTGATSYLKNTKSKLLLLDFWFRGCLPCIRSMPVIEKVFKKYKASDLTVYGINKHDREVENFLKSRQVSYQTFLDSDASFTQSIGVVSYPTIILMDVQTGTILFSEIGFSPDLESKLSIAIDAALKQKD